MMSLHLRKENETNKASLAEQKKLLTKLEYDSHKELESYKNEAEGKMKALQRKLEKLEEEVYTAYIQIQVRLWSKSRSKRHVDSDHALCITVL